MRNSLKTIVSLFLALTCCTSAIVQAAQPKQTVLITSANIFDGKSKKLATGMSVLVEGNKIAKIAKSIPAPAGATDPTPSGHWMPEEIPDQLIKEVSVFIDESK